MLPDSILPTSEDDIARILANFEKRLSHLEILEGPGLYGDYVWVNDEKVLGTNGGTFTNGAWRVRDINQEKSDVGGIASIAANQITLDVGTYRCLITAPGWKVDRHVARLFDTTAAAVLLEGTSESAAAVDSTTTPSRIVGRFTLAVQSVLEIQHQCQTTAATAGFGLATFIATEIYTVAEFWREL